MHVCPWKCHSRADHSKIKCQQRVDDECPRGHKITWRCSSLRPSSCASCDAEAELVAKRQQRDLLLAESRQEKQKAYARQLAEIQDEIDHYRQLMREKREDSEREIVLRQNRQDLESVRTRAQQAEEVSSVRPKPTASASEIKNSQRPVFSQGFPNACSKTEAAINTTPEITGHSPSADEQDLQEDDSSKFPASLAREDWEHEKEYEGAKNKALDEKMAMIGLENVKEAFMEIKSKIDLAIR